VYFRYLSLGFASASVFARSLKANPAAIRSAEGEKPHFAIAFR
jgi:hypothetical protein